MSLAGCKAHRGPFDHRKGVLPGREKSTCRQVCPGIAKTPANDRDRPNDEHQASRNNSRARLPQVLDAPVVCHLPGGGRVTPDVLERLLAGEALQEVPGEEAAQGVVARLLPDDHVQAVVADADRGRVRGPLVGGPEDADGAALVEGRLEVARAGRRGYRVPVLVVGAAGGRVPDRVAAAFGGGGCRC